MAKPNGPVALREFSGEPGYEVGFSCRPIAGGLSLAFRVSGEIGRLYAAPLPPVEVRAGDDLWKRSCLEAFFFDAGSARYVEINWNVLGEHAVLAFDDYRSRSSEGTDFEVLVVSRSISRSRLEGRLDLGLPQGGRFLLSPAAVLYPAGAPPLHYALAHGSRPDFHARATVEGVGLALP